MYQVGRRQGARPLSPTERRELLYGKDTARGPLAGFMRLTPDSRAPAKADPSARAGVVVVVVVVVLLLLLLLLSLTDVGPIWAQVCPCLGSRLLVLLLLWWLWWLLLLYLGAGLPRSWP